MRKDRIDYRAISVAMDNIPGRAVVCTGCKFMRTERDTKSKSCGIEIKINYFSWFIRQFYEDAERVTKDLKKAPEGCVLKR